MKRISRLATDQPTDSGQLPDQQNPATTKGGEGWFPANQILNCAYSFCGAVYWIQIVSI